MAKATAPQPNVIIPDPETEEIHMETDTPTEFVQHLKESYTQFPAPTESAGKGKKVCKNPLCRAIISARATTCENCGWQFVTGAKAPKTPSTGVRKPRATQVPQAPKPSIMTVYKLLKARNFEISVSVDALSDNPEPIVNTGKELKPLLDIIQSDDCELISTSPSVKFGISLDKMLQLLSIKERH